MSVTWLTSPPMGLDEPTELYMSVSEDWDTEKTSADVTLMCPWAKRYDVLGNLLGYQKEWPYLPGSHILALTGKITPFSGSASSDNGSGNNYVDAAISVHFELSFKSNNNSEATFQESLEPTAEFLTVPYQDFRWGAATGDPLKKEEAPGRLEIGCDYNVTWSQLNTIPIQALTLIGAVNDNPVTSQSLGLTFGRETLLFNPPKISRSVNPTNFSQSRYSMSCKFTYRAAGWNQFWRAKTGQYSRIYHKSNPNTPYNNFPLTSFTGVLP